MIERETRSAAAPSRHLRSYAALATLLDNAFRVPGTRFRVGLDPLIGLIPVAGDLFGSLCGLYGLWVAGRLGASASVQMRMAANLLIDAVVGSIPIAGDWFDFGFKAHARNVALLQKWEADPRRTRRRSTGLLIVISVAVIVILAVVLGLIAWAMIAALRHLH